MGNAEGGKRRERISFRGDEISAMTRRDDAERLASLGPMDEGARGPRRRRHMHERGARVLTVGHIFINVGTRPAVPPIPGLDMGGLPYTALRKGVVSHPTLLESLNNLFMTVDSA
jgi:pyruvate/2-oxoglutarate dehydrogenase complex dihydrolipoamide dehydrogenase (E3) component